MMRVWSLIWATTLRLVTLAQDDILASDFRYIHFMIDIATSYYSNEWHEKGDDDNDIIWPVTQI